MALLSKIEAAIALGISVELLDHFTKKCPKPHGSRKLISTLVENQEMFTENEIQLFNDFLNEPWPLPPSGNRPYIPSAIIEDVKQESHMACAICGHMDNGEVAHIVAVSSSLNNSPSNLLLLCPNHHTKYDLGFKPASNISFEVIKAAKLVKRNSRVRMLQAEANVTRLLRSLYGVLKSLEGKLNAADADSLTAKIYLTESTNVLGIISKLAVMAQSSADTSAGLDAASKLLVEKAPTLAKLTAPNFKQAPDTSVRSAAASVLEVGHEIFSDIDEVDCPHCAGRGVTGLSGDYCDYCRGSQVVTAAKADRYDPDDIDEVDCPHCGGSGLSGLAGEYCSFCKGSQMVTHAKAEDYKHNHIDEVDCPHCGGSGLAGLAGDFCSFCKGSQTVTQVKAKDYNPDDLDEVDCPHCGGSGQTGLAGDYCSFCRGSQTVTQVKAKDYNPDDLDEVDCPHCGGSAQTGLAGDYCSFCKGSQKVSQAQADEYNSDDIDEVECPYCGGSGQTGLSGNFCALCKGSQSVTHVIATAYQNRRFRY
jgi:uncharacterized Zn-finger protein